MYQKNRPHDTPDEDMIIVGTNIRITRTRCLEIIEEVKEGTKEFKPFSCLFPK